MPVSVSDGKNNLIAMRDKSHLQNIQSIVNEKQRGSQQKVKENITQKVTENKPGGRINPQKTEGHLYSKYFSFKNEVLTDGIKPVKREFVKDGRENWNQYLDLPVETDGNKKLKDIVYDVSRKTGVRPEVLFASAMEEGLQTAKKGNKISFEKDKNGNYIDGYASLGLDNVGDDIQKMRDDGYLKKEISYTPYKRKNDGVGKNSSEVNTAYFDTLEDGLYAKAAYLNREKDKVKKYAADNKINLNEDSIDFLSMQSYIGGSGVLPKAIEKYKKNNLLEGNKFLDKAPEGTIEENPSYYGTRKRYDNMKYMQDLGTFKDYTSK
jgi:hypothetical protein